MESAARDTPPQCQVETFMPIAGIMPSAGLLLAQAGESPIVAGGQITSVWDFVIKGGPTMAVIGLCSLVALTVIVERLIVTRRRTVIPADFVTALRGMGSDRARALEFCRANGSPLADILGAAIRRRSDGTAAIEKAVEEAGRRVTVGLRRRMRLLGALPQVSTMLGLLGTIFGMIKTFQAIATSGQALGKTELLAKGIFEAWTCTAAGLLVAIPVLIAYHALLGRIDGRIVELDRVVDDWVEQERTGVPLAAAAPVVEAHRPAPAAPAVLSATVPVVAVAPAAGS
jgi:biopolymer transport protein ExbB